MKSYTLEIVALGRARGDLRAEAQGACTLDELHEVLVAELGLEEGRSYSFFRSAEQEAHAELGGPGREAHHQAQGWRLDRLGLRPGAKLLHVHDVEGEARELREVRVRAVRELGGGGGARLELLEPREVTSDEDRLRVIAADLDSLLEELDAREDDPEHGDRTAPTADEERADAERQRDLAQRVLDWVDEDPARLLRLTRRSAFDVEGWLIHVPLELSSAGLGAEGAALAERAARFLQPQVVLADRAWILAEAGRCDEARAQADACLERFPRDAWVALTAGDVCESCGDDARAEELFRRGLELAEDEPFDRMGALERLAALLERLGRGEEAREFADELEELEDSADPEDDDELEGGWGAWVRSTAPDLPGDAQAAPGRNDPCPCGSGKKFKRCCASAHAAGPSEAELLADAGEHIAEHEGSAPPPEEVRGAAALFAGEGLADLDPTELPACMPSEALLEHFWQWLLLDWRTADGSTWAERYLRKRGAKVGTRERALVERLAASHLSLYAIDVRAQDGRQQLVLRDLLLERDHILGTALSAAEPAHGELLVTRLLELDGAPTSPLPPLLVPASERERFVREARARFEELSARAGRGLEQVLALHGHELTRMWLDSEHRAELASWAGEEAPAAADG